MYESTLWHWEQYMQEYAETRGGEMGTMDEEYQVKMSRREMKKIILAWFAGECLPGATANVQLRPWQLDEKQIEIWDSVVDELRREFERRSK